MTKKTAGAKRLFYIEVCMYHAEDIVSAISAIVLYTYNLNKEFKYGKDADPFTRRKIPVNADPKDDIAWWYNLIYEDFRKNFICVVIL